MTDNIWMHIDKVTDVSTSKFINVDKETGEVLNSFQFTNKQTGFNLKIFKVYDFSTDELLITADGTYNNNLIGYSANSNNDAMLLILNLTSQLISQNSVCDCQNGVELATSVEYDSDYIYSFGQKDNTYLFLKKHNITSLELINQKIYLPTTVSPQPEGSKVFYSYGMFQNNIVCIYMSYIDEFSLTLFDKNTLNLFKNWQIGDYLISNHFLKIWVQLDSRSKLVITSSNQTLLFIILNNMDLMILVINLTNTDTITSKVIGIQSKTYYGLNFSISNKITKLIDGGGFLFYFISEFQNYNRMNQISLFKMSYDLEYLDSCITPLEDVETYFTSAYYFTNMVNMTFTCKQTYIPVNLDVILRSEFEFNNTPLTIWPRPDINNYSNCKPPSSSFLSQSNRFYLALNDSTPNTLLKICEQCQGVPINQTSLISILPNSQTDFLNFQPNCVIEIITNKVNQVDTFTLIVQNQMKLLSPNMTNFRQIEYIWNDQITFTLELYNSIPQLKSSLSTVTSFVGKELPINLEFADSEDDQVIFVVKSSSESFNISSLIQETNPNNYIITWIPTLQDEGSVTINLTYFDQFHQLTPQSAQLNFVIYNSAYFETACGNQTIYVGQKSYVLIPNIINLTNQPINLEIIVSDQSNETVDISSWFTFNQSAITVFPKCELFGSNQNTSFIVILSLSVVSQQSFILTVVKNYDNNVCNQQNISFVAGTPTSIQFKNIVNSSIINSKLIVLTNNEFFSLFFYYFQYNQTINISNTNNSNLNETLVALQLTDSSNTEYQTNEFKLIVVLNKPPTAVFNPGKYTFYENSMINVMRFNQSLFIDDDHIQTKVNECILNNSKIVSFSIYDTPVQGFISSINIYFIKDFIGKCTYEITATDYLSQTCSTQIDIFVSPCAQKECIKCNGQAQIDCILCINGYEIEKETGTCFLTSYSNPFKNSNNLLIKLLIFGNIVLSIYAVVLKMPKEIFQLVIFVNQILLLSVVFDGIPSNAMSDFLSILQIMKIDLKFLDSLFYSRLFVNSQFYSDQFVDMSQFSFDSGSTLANFCNLFYILLLFLTLFAFIKLTANCKPKIYQILENIYRFNLIKLLVSIFKICLLFILLNCFSELSIQIKTKFDQNNLISFIISDTLIALSLLIIIFGYKFKSTNSIFTQNFVVGHERINLIKLVLFSLCFTLKILWRYSRYFLLSNSYRWGLPVFQGVYLVYCFCIPVYSKIVYKLLFITIHLLTFYFLLLCSIGVNSDSIEDVKRMLIVTINVIMLSLLIIEFAILLINLYKNRLNKMKSNTLK